MKNCGLLKIRDQIRVPVIKSNRFKSLWLTKFDRDDTVLESYRA